MSHKVKVYNEKGEAVKDIELSPAVFSVKINPSVIHQVILALQANSRLNLAHTKDRSEVRGGGRKPWKQKGTGRARHGSIRSPLWVGGGVTFGPRNDRNFSQKINKKMKRKALCMSLSDRAQSGMLKVLEMIDFNEFKTNRVVNLLKKLDLTKSVLIVSDKANLKLVKSVANLPKVEMIEARNLNVLEVAKYQNLLIMEGALEKIEKTFLDNKKEKVEIKKKEDKVMVKKAVKKSSKK